MHITLQHRPLPTFVCILVPICLHLIFFQSHCIDLVIIRFSVNWSHLVTGYGDVRLLLRIKELELHQRLIWIIVLVFVLCLIVEDYVRFHEWVVWFPFWFFLNLQWRCIQQLNSLLFLRWWSRPAGILLLPTNLLVLTQLLPNEVSHQLNIFLGGTDLL